MTKPLDDTTPRWCLPAILLLMAIALTPTPVEAQTISGGANSACAIVDDGKVMCWGGVFPGPVRTGDGREIAIPTEVVGIVGASAVATGGGTGADHGCVIVGNGRVQCWGRNHRGQLGDGTTLDSDEPVDVLGIGNAASLVMGPDATCAVLAAGRVKCWGWNYEHLFGTWDGEFSATPREIAGLENVQRLAIGGALACALMTSGHVKCWGYGTGGRLGDGQALHVSTTPVDVVGVSDAIDIAANGLVGCAVLGDGRVTCWGIQVGDGSTGISLPTLVPSISNAVAASANGSHVCLLLADGLVSCWGTNYGGQFGVGDRDTRLRPTMVAGLDQVVEIAAAPLYTCARRADGSARCWGYNASGQLGNGEVGFAATPTDVQGIDGATALVGGIGHACAISGSGLACWGDNDFGGIGDGTLISRATPVAVTGLEQVTAVGAGGYLTCATQADGEVRCWGDNRIGWLAVGSAQDRVVLPARVAEITHATQLSHGLFTQLRTGHWWPGALLGTQPVRPVG